MIETLLKSSGKIYDRRRGITFMLCIYMCSSSILAQDKYYQNIEELVDAAGPLANTRLDYFAQKEFSNLISTNSDGMIGNFVGLSTENKALSFAYNISRDNSSTEFSFSGAVNNGISGIFSENKFKTGIELGVKHSFLVGGKGLQIVFDDVKAIRTELENLKQQNELYKKKNKIEELKLEKSVEEKDQQIEDLKKKIGKYLAVSKEGAPLDINKDRQLKAQKLVLENNLKILIEQKKNMESIKRARLKELNSGFTGSKNPTDYDRYVYELKKIDVENLESKLNGSIAGIQAQIAGLMKDMVLNTYSKDSLHRSQQQLEIAEQERSIESGKYERAKIGWDLGVETRKYEDNRRKILDKFPKLRPRGKIRLHWLSVGGKVSSNRYKFFNPLNLRDVQFSEVDDLVV